MIFATVPSHLYPRTARRVRLFRRGDEIANDVLQKKLQREYRRLGQLRQYIFWTKIGREGALHFKEQLRQKKMAEHLQESVAGGISVEKTQKMIKKCVTARLAGMRAMIVGPHPHRILSQRHRTPRKSQSKAR